MKIAEFLSPDDVMIDTAVANKQKLLQALAQKAGSILDVLPQHVLAELQKREELGSTGVGGGIALPHARFYQAIRPKGVLVLLRKAIDFDAVDGQPVDIVFLLLLPEAPDSEQLGALAAIARKLRKPEIVAALREARDAAQVYRTVTAE
jgi:nitrogen PTS system EIIA component